MVGSATNCKSGSYKATNIIKLPTTSVSLCKNSDDGYLGNFGAASRTSQAALPLSGYSCNMRQLLKFGKQTEPVPNLCWATLWVFLLKPSMSASTLRQRSALIEINEGAAFFLV